MDCFAKKNFCFVYYDNAESVEKALKVVWGAWRQVEGPYSKVSMIGSLTRTSRTGSMMRAWVWIEGWVIEGRCVCTDHFVVIFIIFHTVSCVIGQEGVT